jgi:hypothetical protein
VHQVARLADDKVMHIEEDASLKAEALSVERPRLFGALPNGLFSVFQRSSRVEYAQLILDIWRTFYADPLIEQPSTKDLAAFIDDRLRERKNELGEEFAGAEASAGSQILRILVDAGWLSLFREGYHTYVDMPEIIARLIRFLADLQRNSAMTFGGAVASMRAALEAARLQPDSDGLAVRDTADRAEEFLNRLRAMASSLRRVEGLILSEADPAKSLARFFEGFFSVLVSDWHALKTTDNPYRHRGEVVGIAITLLDDGSWIRRAALAYREQGLSADIPDAQAAVRADLERIRSALAGFERLMGRIDGVRRRIERRIAITVTYLELAGEGTNLRIAALLRRLGALDLPAETTTHPSGIAVAAGGIGAEGLAKPRVRRPRLAGQAPRPRAPDPLVDAFAKARLDFQERIRVGHTKVSAFTARQCGPGGSLTAEQLRIETLEDLVVYLALPGFGGRQRRGPGYAILLLPGRSRQDLVDGPAFRLDSTFTPPASGDPPDAK